MFTVICYMKHGRRLCLVFQSQVKILSVKFVKLINQNNENNSNVEM